MDINRKKLEEKVGSEFDNLDKINPGTEERSRAVEDFVKLYKTLEDAKNQKVRHVMDAVGIAAPVAFYSIWMVLGLKFEETGFLKSKVFQGLTKNFKPFRR